MKTDIKTSAGLVSAYGFACGYCERAKFGETEVSLWREHGVYHVRAHNFGYHGRLFWDSFRLLSDARKRFMSAGRSILSGHYFRR